MNLEDKIIRLLDYAPKEYVDCYAKNALLEEMEKYRSRNYKSLANFRMFIDEVAGDFYDLILKMNFRLINIVLDQPHIEGVWNYNPPIKSIKIAPDGLGFVHLVLGRIDRERWKCEEGIKNKVMVRAYITKYYQPKTIHMISNMIEPPPPNFSLRTLENIIKDVVTQGIVPFEIKLLLYTPAQRFSMTLDLVNSVVVSDPREGRMNPRLYKSREPLEYFTFDSLIASINIPSIAKEILEIVLESEGLTLTEISYILNISAEVAKNNLSILINRNLVMADENARPTKYMINPEKLKNK